MAAGSQVYLPPAFYRGLDGPKFTIVEKEDDIELRKYQPTVWVTYHMKGVAYDGLGAAWMWKLFRYISGSNTRGVRIPMAIPVVVRVETHSSFDGVNDFSMSFYIPSDLHGDPPAPTDPELVIDRRGTFSVYVASYPGFAGKKEHIQNCKRLLEKLDVRGQGSIINRNLFHICGYDSPLQLFNRHNEIWILRTEELPEENNSTDCMGRNDHTTI